MANIWNVEHAKKIRVNDTVKRTVYLYVKALLKWVTRYHGYMYSSVMRHAVMRHAVMRHAVMRHAVMRHAVMRHANTS